jgi:MoaA/NifB/PqqE/SkfB family radical SAM enzyme
VKEKADIAAAITTTKKKLREVLNNTVSMEKKHGTVLEKIVRLLLEAKLKKSWNIEHSRYHGRDSEGSSVRRLMEHSTEMFSAMENILLEAATAKGWSNVKKAQIREHCHVRSENYSYLMASFLKSKKMLNNQPKNQG